MDTLWRIREHKRLPSVTEMDYICCLLGRVRQPLMLSCYKIHTLEIKWSKTPKYHWQHWENSQDLSKVLQQPPEAHKHNRGGCSVLTPAGRPAASHPHQAVVLLRWRAESQPGSAARSQQQVRTLVTVCVSQAADLRHLWASGLSGNKGKHFHEPCVWKTHCHCPG